MEHGPAVLLGAWGLAFVFLNVFIEQLGLPIPAVPILLVAGAIAATRPTWGALSFALALAACVVTDWGWFYAGRIYGNRLMRFLCQISLSPDSCVGQTQVRFERWGAKAIVLAKFIPGLSLIAPPLSGALRLRPARFMALTSLGSILWVGGYMALGIIAAPQILKWLPRAGALRGRALGLLALLLGLYVLFKWWERRRFYSMLRMARVDVHELNSMMQRQPPPRVLDVRSRSARELDPRSIPGALHIPPEEVPRLLASVDTAGEVVVYCTCPNEATAARIARLLMDNGVVRVRPLHGGLDAWVSAGYPVSLP